MKRRQFITGAVSAGTVSLLAGCIGGGDSGGNSEEQDATPTETISASEEWQRRLNRCSNSEAKIAVREIRVDAENRGYISDGKVLVAIENLDIYSLNIVDISVTYSPADRSESQTVYWNERSDEIEDDTGPDENRILDGEELQSYTIDASFSDGDRLFAADREVLGIGSDGEILDVDVFTADNPEIGTTICWKPTDS